MAVGIVERTQGCEFVAVSPVSMGVCQVHSKHPLQLTVSMPSNLLLCFCYSPFKVLPFYRSYGFKSEITSPLDQQRARHKIGFVSRKES